MRPWQSMITSEKYRSVSSANPAVCGSTMSAVVQEEGFHALTSLVQRYLVTSVTAELVDTTEPTSFTVDGRSDPLLPTDSPSVREMMVRSHYGAPRPLRTASEWTEWATTLYVTGIEGAFGVKALSEADLRSNLPDLLHRRVYKFLMATVEEAEHRLINPNRPVDTSLATWILTNGLPVLYGQMRADALGEAFFTQPLARRDTEVVKQSRALMSDIRTLVSALDELLGNQVINGNFTKGLRTLHESVEGLELAVSGRVIDPASVRKALKDTEWTNDMFRDGTINYLISTIWNIARRVVEEVEKPTLKSLNDSPSGSIKTFDASKDFDKDGFVGAAVQQYSQAYDLDPNQTLLPLVIDTIVTRTLANMNDAFTFTNGDKENMYTLINETPLGDIVTPLFKDKAIKKAMGDYPVLVTFPNTSDHFLQVGRESLLVNVRAVKTEIQAWFQVKTPQWADLILSIDTSLRVTLANLAALNLSLDATTAPILALVQDFLTSLRDLRPRADGVWPINAREYWHRLHDHVRYLLMGKWSTFEREEKIVRRPYMTEFWKSRIPSLEEDQSLMADDEIRALTATLDNADKGTKHAPEVDKIYEHIFNQVATIEMLYRRIRNTVKVKIRGRIVRRPVGLGKGRTTASIREIVALRYQIQNAWRDVRETAIGLRTNHDDHTIFELFFSERPISDLDSLIISSVTGDLPPPVRNRLSSTAVFARDFVTNALFDVIHEALTTITESRMVVSGTTTDTFRSYPHISTEIPITGNEDPRFAITRIERQDKATGHFYYHPTTEDVTNRRRQLTRARQLLDQKLAEQVQAGLVPQTAHEAKFFDLVRNFANMIHSSDGIYFYGGQAEHNGSPRSDVGNGDFDHWWKLKQRDTTVKPLCWQQQISFWVGQDSLQSLTSMETIVKQFNRVDRIRDSLHYIHAHFTMIGFDTTIVLPAEIETAQKTRYRARIDFFYIDVTPYQMEVIERWETFLTATQTLAASVRRVIAQFATGVPKANAILALDDLDVIMQESHMASTSLFETNNASLGRTNIANPHAPFSLHTELTRHSTAVKASV